MNRIKKYMFFWIIGFVLFFLIILLALSFYHPDFYSNNLYDRILVTIRFLFVTENNRFNWVGVSALGVMVSYAVNSKFNRDKLRAELVSTSRMKWLDNMKIVTTEFVNDVQQLNANKVMFFEKLLQLDELHKSELKKENLKREDKEILKKQIKYIEAEMQERVSILNSLTLNIDKNSTLIRLNFSDNDENNKIVNKVHIVAEDIRIFSLKQGWAQYASFQEKMEFLEEAKKIRSNHAKLITELINDLRSYNQREWIKVKNGN